MENLEYEFIDRSISAMKDGYNEEAAKIVEEESNLTLNEARTFVSLLHQMGE